MIPKNTEVIIRDATVEDFKAAHAILHTCFSTDPAFSWFADDPEERYKLIGDFLVAYVKLGLEQGTIHLAEVPELGVVGVSIWRPHDAEDEESDNELIRLAGDNVDRLMMQIEAVSRNYPPLTPYEVLMATVVHPSAQGHGIGSKLIAHRLEELDRIQMPTYLEATTRRSASGLYERFGYQPVGESMKFLYGVEVFPMWRHPCAPLLAPNKDTYMIAGSTIKFGNYGWRVLDVQGDRALIFCNEVIQTQKYHERFEAVSWKECSLRRYLNGDFYNSFNNEEQSQILESHISNDKNPWFDIEGGEDTRDKIFLLSIEEAVKYLGDSGQLRSKTAKIKFYVDDHFNKARIASCAETPSPWWLRSPGNASNFAACVAANGRITVSGNYVTRDNNEGIRPALWLKL